MKFENVKEKAVSIYKKIGKKTIIVAACVLLVGLAVLLNVILWNIPADNDKGLTPSDAALSGAEQVQGSEASAGDSYFAEMALSRNQARDEAIEVLSGVLNSDTAVAEMKADAQSQINRIATDMEREANIEALIASKGLGESVAVISGDSANIIVRLADMTEAQVSQISEIVYEQSGIIPANLKIINN